MFSCYTLKDMKRSKEHMKLHKTFESIISLSSKLEKTPRPYGTDELLTSPEIHLIEATGDSNETMSVTDIAQTLDVTKGAVSQKLKRLEKKGLCTKEQDPENASRSIVKLTSKGKTAYFAHKHWHETMDGGFMEYFGSLTTEQNEFLLTTLEKIEDFMKRILY